MLLSLNKREEKTSGIQYNLCSFKLLMYIKQYYNTIYKDTYILRSIQQTQIDTCQWGEGKLK